MNYWSLAVEIMVFGISFILRSAPELFRESITFIGWRNNVRYINMMWAFAMSASGVILHQLQFLNSQ